jgi:glycerophosphoryl diester phosphodiesterase
MKDNKKTLKKLGLAVGIPSAFALAARLAYTGIRYGKKTAKDTVNVATTNDLDLSDVHFTAHRGLSSVAPENTLDAFREAAKYNYYALECDVHYTTDGKWVIIHDYMLQSMAKEKGDVKTMSYEDLKKIKFTNGANIDKYPDAGVCLVEEYIEICKEANIKPMIEVKDRRIDKVKSLLDIIRAYDIEDDVIIISFHASVLREFKRLSPDMDLWLLVHGIKEEKLHECIENGFGVAFEAKRALRDLDKIQNIHNNQLTAACWTVDTPELLKTMVEHGVKYITTNALLPE